MAVQLSWLKHETYICHICHKRQKKYTLLGPFEAKAQLSWFEAWLTCKHGSYWLEAHLPQAEGREAA